MGATQLAVKKQDSPTIEPEPDDDLAFRPQIPPDDLIQSKPYKRFRRKFKRSYGLRKTGRIGTAGSIKMVFSGTIFSTQYGSDLSDR